MWVYSSQTFVQCWAEGNFLACNWSRKVWMTERGFLFLYPSFYSPRCDGKQHKLREKPCVYTLYYVHVLNCCVWLSMYVGNPCSVRLRSWQNIEHFNCCVVVCWSACLVKVKLWEQVPSPIRCRLHIYQMLVRFIPSTCPAVGKCMGT